MTGQLLEQYYHIRILYQCSQPRHHDPFNVTLFKWNDSVSIYGIGMCKNWHLAFFLSFFSNCICAYLSKQEHNIMYT